MTCADVERLVDPYSDGELNVERALALEEHAHGCPACTGLIARRRELRSAIRAHAPYHSAPPGLAAKIRLAAAVPPATVRPRAASARPWQWATAAASIIAAAAIATLWSQRRPADAELQNAVVTAHVESRLANHLTDVPSSDRHTVKPWLSSHLDFSPTVPDLAAQGFPLVGGRLDYLDGHPVAALVYQRRQHVINVLVWPSAGGDAAPARSADRRGYNLVHWTSRQFTYWAVSDLSADELAQFANALRAEIDR